MKNWKHFVFVAILAFSCVIYGNAQNNSQPMINTYIAGSYMDGNTEKACYWKNGERITLENGRKAVAITVANGKVYTAGDYLTDKVYAFDIFYSKPCYWIDGIRIAFPNYIYGTIKSMTVINGSVYSIGVDTYPTRSDYYLLVNTNTQSSSKECLEYITTVDGVTYISGYSGSPYYSAYGQRVGLDGSNAYGITVVNGSVYVAGNDYRSNNSIPCYWVDGVKRVLPGIGVATRIAVINGVEHVIGHNNRSGNDYEAYYWVNGEKTQLTNAASFSEIKNYNGNIYITGSFKQGAINIACVWKNGERFVIPGGKTALDIVVVQE